MILIVGLGNPGKKYARNRHNIGFMAVDAIADRHGPVQWRAKFNGELADIKVGSEKALLLKPRTFMNNSGQSVSETARFYKIGAKDVVVFYDELDLAPSKIKIKSGGGSAGHNGIKSVDAHLGNEFRRVRLGIGHPGHKDRVMPWVLGNFAKADEGWVDDLLSACAQAAPFLAVSDDARFMTEVARLRQNTKPESVPVTKDKKPAAPASPVEDEKKSGPLAAGLRKLFGKD